MQKTILITGSTDGLGLATATALSAQGHRVLIHGRSEKKLAAAHATIAAAVPEYQPQGFVADLSRQDDVRTLAEAVKRDSGHIDVLINNAGVYVVHDTLSVDGLDVRFMVNTIAPYLLTRLLLPLMDHSGRVVNLTSAAQSSLQVEDLANHSSQNDSTVYAKSKLALLMWTRHLAAVMADQGPMLVAVNPGSFLATKMVAEAYGRQGSDLQQGVSALLEAALGDSFLGHSGGYFDNDRGQFATPHPDAMDRSKNEKLVAVLEQIIRAE